MSTPSPSRFIFSHVVVRVHRAFGHGISPMDYSKSGTYFAAVDAAGNIVQAERRVAAEALAGSPALAWTGNEYTLVTASSGAHFVRLDSVGDALGQATALSEVWSWRSPSSAVAFSGQSVGLVWRNAEDLMVSSFLACLDPSASRSERRPQFASSSATRSAY